MSDFSTYTHKWRAAPAGSHQIDGNKVNKRNRQPVSCAPCRSRKLKCDRGHPCDACTKRNDEESCVYGKVATTTTPRRDESKTNMKAQERLRHLEELVKQMIGGEKGLPSPQTPPVEDSHQPEGSLSKDIHGISYTGSTHWATVLDQIQELRNTLSPSNSADDEKPVSGGSADSIFAAPTPPPLDILLQKYLPSRDECNRYLSTYFNSQYTSIPFVHKYQFRRQYEKFWENQLETSPIWISMLFSIMCIADGIRRAPLSLYRTDHATPKLQAPFLTASAQCLVLGNYAKPQPYVVEALSMYSQCKYAVTLDPSHELGMAFSIISRQAYTMGYHREPSVFENQFTAFEGEMRRRCWSLLKQFDMMASFQLGLPAVLQPDSSDTRLPSHLLDEDFDENTTVLPPSRPDTEPTQMLYLITKARLMDKYGEIFRHTLTFPKEPFTIADVNKLDESINDVIASVPPALQARSISSSYADPNNITMCRSNLMFLGEKARCVLHRKYMVTGPNADYSRQQCIESSTRGIKHFLDIHAELQPGGQLFNDRWMLTSFTINDFLLSLTVLCLAFSLGRKNYIAGGGDAERWLEQDQEAKRLYELLAKAQPVCAEYGTKAREAKHVSEAVRLVLMKLKPKTPESCLTGHALSANKASNQRNRAVQASPMTDVDTMPLDIMPLSIHNNDYTMQGFDPTMQFGNAQMSITPDSSYDFGTSTSGPLTFSNPTEPSPTASWELADGPLSNVIDGPEQIDWVQFDQFLWTYGIQNPMDEEVL